MSGRIALAFFLAKKNLRGFTRKCFVNGCIARLFAFILRNECVLPPIFSF